MEEIRARAERNERVLVTTLTKRMAEDLAEYYTELGLRVRYLHSEVETLDRIKILRALRAGEFDALIGINLLREGLDLPEVSLVAILDADKEGFLRSTTSLIQTDRPGGPAHQRQGDSLRRHRSPARCRQRIDETSRRRAAQQRYNEENDITPQSIIKPLDPELVRIYEGDYYEVPAVAEEATQYASAEELEAEIRRLEGRDARGGQGVRIREGCRLARPGQETQETRNGISDSFRSRAHDPAQSVRPEPSPGPCASPGTNRSPTATRMLAALAEGTRS